MDALPVSNVTAPKKKPSTETLVRCNQPQSWNWSDRQELWNGNRLTDPMDVRCAHTSMHSLPVKTNSITLAGSKLLADRLEAKFYYDQLRTRQRNGIWLLPSECAPMQNSSNSSIVSITQLR